MKKRTLHIFNIIFLLLGIGIIYYIGYRIGWGEIWAKILSISPLELGIILILPIGWHLFHSLGWFFLLAQKSSFNFLHIIGAHLSSAAVSEVVPMGQAGGEPYRAYFVRKQYSREKSPNIIASIILYNTIHSIATGILFAVGFIMILSIIDVQIYKRILFILALVVGFGVVVFFIQKQKKGFMSKIFDILGRFRPLQGFVERKRPKAEMVDERLGQFYREHRIFFYISLLFVGIAKSFGAIEVYLIMKFIGYPISFMVAFIVFSGSALIQLVLFFFPAQIGASEGSVVYLLSVLGHPPIYGITLALFRRIRVIFWTIIGLIIGYIWGPKPGEAEKADVD
jgi:hypothetical protein